MGAASHDVIASYDATPPVMTHSIRLNDLEWAGFLIEVYGTAGTYIFGVDGALVCTHTFVLLVVEI